MNATSTVGWLDAILLAAAALLLAAGQILFKWAASSAPPVGTVGGLLLLLVSPATLVAGIVYLAATALYLVILQRIPLSVAYPVMALGFAIVPLASSMIFAESLAIGQWAGIALILAGVILVGALH